MLSNYLTIAWRNLTRNKGYSAINIVGLSIGMATAMLIGLWMYDELSYDKNHQNYDRIAQLMQHETTNGTVITQFQVPFPMGKELVSHYGHHLRYVVMSTSIKSRILTSGDKVLAREGVYIDTQAPELLSLKMLRGTRAGLTEPHSILLSESVAKAFFGDADPMGRLMQIDNKQNMQVTGVYEDLPDNSTFRNMRFLAPFALFASSEAWVKDMENSWDSRHFATYVQLDDNADMDHVSAQIRNIRLDRMDRQQAKIARPEVFLQPMARWHLYAEFKNGVNTGGQIEFVWLFGLIGGFVLLLACINFMNLSTASSQKRAREVGIRKVIGSGRAQLVGQFLGESLLMVAFAFGFGLLLVAFTLPFFNQLADKKMAILWTNPWFWLLSLGFSLFTGLLAGSYPALYLSAFQPIKVLKGNFRVGRLATLPRQMLVVVQFTVSVSLIIGTIMVFRQIEFVRNRPLGYNQAGLLMIPMTTKGLHVHFDAFRDELTASGAATRVAESEAPLTAFGVASSYFDWKGKDPNQGITFLHTTVSPEFGKTVGWQLREGRDFSKAVPSDQLAVVLNEAAVKAMGFARSGAGSPVGQIINFGRDYTIIGVIKDIIVESPYTQVRPYVYRLTNEQESANATAHFFFIRINPAANIAEVLRSIETVFKNFSPAAPFDYKFVDEEYARKFFAEERIGKLARVFTVLAIFISCLGLFGLASFVAGQRTREIGIRKVLGASVVNLWQLLSKDFVLLVSIAFLIATPLAYYVIHNWLLRYEFRTDISWGVFAIAGVGALAITLLTVSFQAVKAALMNPVKSLGTE